MSKDNGNPKDNGNEKKWRGQFPVENVAKALNDAGGVQIKAAKLLGCGQPTVAKYVQRFPLLRQIIKTAKERVLEERRQAREKTLERTRKQSMEKRRRRHLKEVNSKWRKVRDYEEGIAYAESLYGKMTLKQRRFVEEYLIDGVAKQAALRAGYSETTANDDARQMLSHPKVRSAIQRSLLERSLRTGIKSDDVVRELGRLAFANIDDFISWSEQGIEIKDSEMLDFNQKACISEVTERATADGDKVVKIKFYDKLDALKQLAKHLGMFQQESSNVHIQLNVKADKIRMDIASKLEKVANLSDEEIKKRLEGEQQAKRPALVDVTPEPANKEA